MPRVPHQFKTHHSFECTNVTEAMPILLHSLLTDGQEVGSRLGERTMEILMPRIALWKPWQREVLVPGRKASIAAQIAETMWVLAGRNDVKWLSHYLPRAGDFSDDGTTWSGGYGPRLRAWGLGDTPNPVDQLDRVVNELKNNRGTRRAVMSIYDPSVDSIGGKDIPCNNWLSFISRNGKLHLNVATRSNDVIWGWSGINQFEWSVLQEIVANLTGNQIGTLTFNVTSFHVYEKHWDKARDIINRSNDPAPLAKESPRFDPTVKSVEYLDRMLQLWFEIEDQIRNGYASQMAVDKFHEPMLRSWLRVIQWYWSGDGKYLAHAEVRDTGLERAALMSPSRSGLKAKITSVEPDGTVTAVVDAKSSPDLYEMLSRGASGEYGMSIREIKPDGTMVETPIEVSHIVNPDTRDKEQPLLWTTQFVEYVDNLHREKSKVYGDSWKRRGEQMAILANIARKVDRLGEGGAGDTAADTVIDLLVYLAKYALWLNEQAAKNNPFAPEGEDAQVRAILDVEDRRCVKVVQRASIPPRVVALKEFFEQLTILVREHEIGNALQARMEIVDHMISLAFPTARYFWGVENGHLLTGAEAATVITGAVFKIGDDTLEEVGAKIKKDNETRFWAGYGENID